MAEKKLRFLADEDEPPKFNPDEIIDHLHNLEDGSVVEIPEGKGNYTETNIDEDGYITINQAKFKTRDFWN